LYSSSWQAYKARNVNVEFQESKYIGLANARMLQAYLSKISFMIGHFFSLTFGLTWLSTQPFIVGIPMIAFIKENLSAMFIVVSLLILITGTAVMLLLFVPKYKSYKEFDPKKSKQTMRDLYPRI
jgi:hypothetical protein